LTKLLNGKPVEQTLKDFKQTIKDILRGIPGASVGFEFNGTRHIWHYGSESLETEVSISDSSLFQIGSVTKLFTSMLITRAIKDNRLTYDTTVQTILPWFSVGNEEVSRTVTLKHLLTHQAGWQGDLFEHYGCEHSALTTYVTAMSALRQIHGLGAAVSYCNSGYVLLGLIAERLLQMPYELAIKKYIFDQLGMPHSCFCEDVTSGQFRVAGHIHGNVAQPWGIPRSMSPSGGIVSTAGDLLTFLSFHEDELRKGIASDYHQTYQCQSVFIRESSGYGWEIQNKFDSSVYCHGGLTNGQAAFAALIPALGRKIVVLTNCLSGSFAARRIANAFYAYIGMEQIKPDDQQKHQTHGIPLAGEYKSDFQDISITVRGGKGVLSISPTADFPYIGCAKLPAPAPMDIEYVAGCKAVVTNTDYKGTVIDFFELDSKTYLRFGKRLYIGAHIVKEEMESEHDSKSNGVGTIPSRGGH
jgi:CubicO group peptidase (beta-lactamase class C family)